MGTVRLFERRPLYDLLVLHAEGPPDFGAIRQVKDIALGGISCGYVREGAVRESGLKFDKLRKDQANEIGMSYNNQRGAAQ